MGGSRKRKARIDEGEGGDGATPVSPTGSSSSSSRSTKRRRGNNSPGGDADGSQDTATAATTGSKDEVGGLDIGGNPASGSNADASAPGADNLHLHPLLIDLVLVNLFKYLDPSSLDSARRVCRTWWAVSFPTWRSSGATLKLDYVMANTPEGYRLRRRPRKTKLGKFLDFWEAKCRGSPHPYRQFQVGGWNFDDVKNLDVLRFWQSVGGSIKKLTLVNCRGSQSGIFLKVILHSCPNLETLILEDCVFNDMESWNRVRFKEFIFPGYEAPAQGEHRHLKSLSITKIKNGDGTFRIGCVRMTILQLLSHFPHLTSLDFTGTRHRPIQNDLDLLRAITWIRERGGAGKLPLKQLRLLHPVDFVGGAGIPLDEPTWRERMEIMELAHPLNIPLTSIRLGEDMEDANEIRRIVKLHGPALVKLIAVMDPAHRPCCDFPFGVRLENMKVLEISDGFCNSLKFLKVTPNLQTLRIVDGDDGIVEESYFESERRYGIATALLSNTRIHNLADVRLLRLTTFQLQYVVTEEDVRQLVKWMPNVTNVEMFLNDRQFPVVCQAWTKLVKLKIYGQALTDRGLTGRTNQWTSDLELGDGKVVVKLRKVVQPNITHLRDLQVFDAPNSKLTDASVTHGFLKMGYTLRRVLIRNTQITTAAKRALHRKYIRIDFGFVEPDNSSSYINQ